MAFENIEELEQSFIGRTLTSMNFYNVNDDYFVFNPDNLAVIDGGIELMFEEGILVIAWNAEEELFDVSTNSIKSLLADLDYYQVDSGDLPLGQQLLGSKVASLKAKWNWYQNLDSELMPAGAKQYILNEVIFSFENGHIFQVATINYTIENRSIQNAKFDSQGELLLSVDRIVDIESVS